MASDFKYSIRIYWKNGDTISKWDDICIWALENFGIQGDKFITYSTEDYMDFNFRYEKDAVYFALACV